MKHIGSDNILIKIIELRTLLKVKADKNVQIYLREIEKDTKNHFLMVAIFKYLWIINC